MLSNCVAGESSWESLGQQGDQTVNPKGNQPWIFTGRTDAEALILWPLDAKKQLIGIPWCWERLRAEGKGDDRGWDGLMASPTWWMWVWANSKRQWRTGKPGMLQSMASQRVGHNSSQVAQMVKCLPAMQKIWVQSLGWEDPLEKEVTTHASILAWEISLDRGA